MMQVGKATKRTETAIRNSDFVIQSGRDLIRCERHCNIRLVSEKFWWTWAVFQHCFERIFSMICFVFCRFFADSQLAAPPPTCPPLASTFTVMVSDSTTCVKALASAACHAIIELARGLLTTGLSRRSRSWSNWWLSCLCVMTRALGCTATVK
jgi:hypothetical protein